MNTPVLSVIIPMHNSAQYISQCLDSIIMQEGFPNFQIIVVDDGSGDIGANIVSEYSLKHPNIELFRQKNFGVSVARNRGIDMARGTYISFVDSDDMVGAIFEKCVPYFIRSSKPFRRDNLEVRAGQTSAPCYEQPLGDTKYFSRMIQSAEKSGAEIAMAGKITVHNDEISKFKSMRYTQGRVFGLSPREKQNIITHADERESANFAVYNRDFLNQHNLRFEPDMPLDEDILFCMLATLFAKKIVTVRDSLYYYNQHSGSLTDYPTYMASWESRNRYSSALVQRYGCFLLEIAKYPQYAKIYQKYMHEFFTVSHESTWEHRKYFPICGRNFCYCDTCEDCECNAENVTRIKKGIQKLMPNKIQKTK